MGPFGLSETGLSISPTNNHGLLANIVLEPPFEMPAQTISFYWKTDGKSKGGIFTSDSPLRGCLEKLSIISIDLDLVITIFRHDCSKASANIIVQNVFVRDQFTFVAITYDPKILTIFNDQGDVLATSAGVEMNQQITRRIFLGFGNDEFKNEIRIISNIQSIACLAVYKGVLTSKEIASLPCACQLGYR